MPRIAVVGSANMDLVVHCAALPRPGETVVGHGFATNSGGKGANQAVAAARLVDRGVSTVFFVGCVGDDAHGEALKASMQDAGVGLAHLLTARGAPTGTALITVDDSGENTIVIDPGANALLTAEHVRSALTQIAPDVVLVQLEIPDEAVYACAGHGTLILDPAPARPLDSDFLAQVDWATPNESETHSLTGILPHDEFSQRRAAQALLEKGVKHAVVTLGERGCYYTDGSHDLEIPAPRVEVVDTTAAGDAFAGSLAAFLSEGNTVEVALQNSARCASLSVARNGAQRAMPTRADLAVLQ